MLKLYKKKKKAASKISHTFLGQEHLFLVEKDDVREDLNKADIHKYMRADEMDAPMSAEGGG